MTIKGLLPILGQPDPRVPTDIHLVGRYAVGVNWADGHASIYPFDRLRLDDPDDPASTTLPTLRTLPEGATWPRDIKRLPETLAVTWTDGRESRYPWAELRALCRCAGCTGGH